jgi:hypothetical protein
VFLTNNSLDGMLTPLIRIWAITYSDQHLEQLKLIMFKSIPTNFCVFLNYAEHGLEFDDVKIYFNPLEISVLQKSSPVKGVCKGAFQ